MDSIAAWSGAPWLDQARCGRASLGRARCGKGSMTNQIFRASLGGARLSLARCGSARQALVGQG